MFDAALVRDPTELSALEAMLDAESKRPCIFTIDSCFFLELWRDGWNPKLLGEFISGKEAVEIYERSYQDISRIILKMSPVGEDLALNPGRFFKVHYWEFLTEVYALDLVLSRVLECEETGTLSFFSREYPRPSRHTELTHPGRIADDMLSATMREYPDRVRRLPLSGALHENRTTGLREKLVRQARETKSKLGSLARRGFSVVLGDSLVDREGPRTIALGTGYDALIVIPEAIHQAEASGHKVLWVTEGVDKDTVRSGLQYREEYDAIERFSIHRYLSAHPPSPLSVADSAAAGRAFEELAGGMERLEVISRNHLTDCLTGLRDEYTEVMRRAHAVNDVLARFAGSTVFVTQYNGIDERSIEQLAPKHQIETVARPHGWMSNIEGFEYQADQYLVSGELWRRVVQTFYGQDVPVKLSPDPSLIRVAEEWLQKSAAQRDCEIALARRGLGISAPNVLLFMTTAARKGRILTEFDHAQFLATWNAVFEFLKTHRDVHALIKSHKNNYDSWVAAEAAERGVQNLTVVSGRLEESLVPADLVVDFGKPGSATLVALLFNCPVMLYSGLYKYVRHLGDLTHAEAGASLMQSPRDLIVAWECWLHDGAEYLESLRAANGHLLNLVAELPEAWPAAPRHRQMSDQTHA